MLKLPEVSHTNMLTFVTVNEGAGLPYFHEFITLSLRFYRPTSFYKKFMFVVSSLIDLLGGNGQFNDMLGSGETVEKYLTDKKKWIVYTPSPYTYTYE